MPKIFLWCVPGGWRNGDVIGYALAEDGKGLASHLSSSEDFSKHDMGLTSNWKHEAYQAHYPDGFELEWVADFENNEAFKAAFALNQQAAHPATSGSPENGV
jgi:hypothetical protein